MRTKSSKVTIPKDVVFQQIEEETVLLNLSTGKYFNLDKVATRMWIHLVETKDIHSTIEKLLEEFDVHREQLLHDLMALIQQLEENGLLQTTPPNEKES